MKRPSLTKCPDTVENARSFVQAPEVHPRMREAFAATALASTKPPTNDVLFQILPHACFAIACLSCSGPGPTPPEKSNTPTISDGTFFIDCDPISVGNSRFNKDMQDMASFAGLKYNPNKLEGENKKLIAKAGQYLRNKGLTQATSPATAELVITFQGGSTLRSGSAQKSRWKIKFLRIGKATASNSLHDTRETYPIDAYSNSKLHAQLDSAVARLPSRN